MKKLFYLLILISSCALAQKVDLDTYKVRVSLIDLPDAPVADTLASYSYKYSFFEGADGLGITKDIMSSKVISINGFKINSNNPDMVLYIDFPDFALANPIYSVASFKDKDANGQEKIREEHSYLQPYNLVCKYKLVTSSGKILINETSLQNNFGFNSGKFSTKVLAESDLANNINKYAKVFVAAKLMELAQEVELVLNKQIGYIPNETTIFFETLGSKKHPEFAPWGAACAALDMGFSKMTFQQKNVEASDMKQAIGYFEAIPARYLGTEKEDKKLRYGAYQNLAKLYLFLDDTDKASKYADSLVLNDFNVRDGKAIIAGVKRVAKELAVNKLATRHVDRTQLLAKTTKLEEDFLANRSQKIEEVKKSNAGYAKSMTENRVVSYLFESSSKSIIEKYFKAIGGLETLNQLKSAHVVQATTLFGIPIPMLEEFWVKDGINAKKQVGKTFIASKAIINNQEGWKWDLADKLEKAKGYQSVDQTEYGKYQQLLDSWKFAINIPEFLGSYETDKVIEEMFLDENCDVIHRDGLAEEKYYFSKSTGLLIASVKGNGLPGDSYSFYSDYAKAEGMPILIPYTIEGKVIGKSTGVSMKIKYKKVEFNQGVQEKDFDIKQEN